MVQSPWFVQALEVHQPDLRRVFGVDRMVRRTN